MDIRFVSSLTPEDENKVAEGLLAILTSVLVHLPIAYTIRIDTGTQVLHHSHSPSQETLAHPVRDLLSGSSTV